MMKTEKYVRRDKMSKVKIRILEESIARVKERLEEIKNIQSSDPKLAAVRLEIETIEKAKELTAKGQHAECSKLLNDSMEEYNRLWNSPDPIVGEYADELLEERIVLNEELQELRDELFYAQLVDSKYQASDELQKRKDRLSLEQVLKNLSK